jgi:hypothetical protein
MAGYVGRVLRGARTPADGIHAGTSYGIDVVRDIVEQVHVL